MNRIKDLREDLDMRQIDVARKTGIDQRTLSNYETGKTNPDSEAIVKLAAFFNVSCDYLLGVSDINLNSPEALFGELENMKKHIDLIEKFLLSSYAFNKGRKR